MPRPAPAPARLLRFMAGSEGFRHDRPQTLQAEQAPPPSPAAAGSNAINMERAAPLGWLGRHSAGYAAPS
jgi:hypothetical protein